MMSWVKKLGRSLGLTPIYRIFFRPESSLRKLGWINSVGKNAAVNADNAPIPWMTYPIISFLEERLKKNFRVFEYGSGNSTHWLASRVQSVVSIEHDQGWFDSVSRDLPENCILHLSPVVDSRSYGEMSFGDGSEDNGYVDLITELREKYDVIILDGIYRLSCLWKCVDFLNSTGVLVVDNTNDPTFSLGRQWLQKTGFREIPFHGMAPIHNWLSCSSVFYRSGNCLEI